MPEANTHSEFFDMVMNDAWGRDKWWGPDYDNKDALVLVDVDGFEEEQKGGSSIALGSATSWAFGATSASVALYLIWDRCLKKQTIYPSSHYQRA